jgi:hypothetical protein
MFDLPAGHYRSRLADAGDEPVTVVFLGSSRTGGGVRPALVEESVLAATGSKCLAQNLFVPTVGPFGQMVHWQRLLERGIRPDVLVLEICPAWYQFMDGVAPEMQTFSGDRMTWDEVQLVRSYGFPPRTEQDWRAANWNPWFGFRFQLLGMINPNWLPKDVTRHERRSRTDLGWKEPFFVVHEPWRFAEGIELNRPVLHDRMQDLRFDQPPARCFRDLIESCRAHGTVPAAFVTPEATPIRAWYRLDVEARLQKYLSDLRDHNVIVADGRTWLPDVAFSDGHHVLRPWADEYTRRVVNSVVVPAVKRSGRVNAEK